MAARKKPIPVPALPITSPHEDAVIRAALAILEARLKAFTVTMDNLSAVRDFLKLQLGALDREVFGVLFLNAQHRLIAFDIMFQGTLTQTSVYPREVARQALTHNAASVILAHNHPSGVTKPSHADIGLTRALERSLQLVDVKVLDHVVVGGCNSFSFAEDGLLNAVAA
jgi:DNA repair protein RadC